jgi:hypothetical protein
MGKSLATDNSLLKWPLPVTLLFLGWLALCICVPCILYGFWPEDVCSGKPNSIVSLLLSKSNEASRGTIVGWKASEPKLESLKSHVDQDDRFVWVYVTLSLVWTLLAVAILYKLGRIHSARIWILTAFLAMLAAGIADRCLENPRLRQLHGQCLENTGDQANRSWPEPAIVGHDVTKVDETLDELRKVAIVKFLLLIAGLAASATLSLAMVRQIVMYPSKAKQADAAKPVQIQSPIDGPIQKIEAKLVNGDDKSIQYNSKQRPVDGIDPAPDVEVQHKGVQEPFVVKPGRDLVGMALSGGGIRSATFALGILMRLKSFGFLKHVDYLSTVSGGGYIGGWAKKTNFFQDTATSNHFTEEPAIRHLRRFSNFLAPRWGVLQPETWLAAVAVTGGLLPSLLISTALIMLGQCLWLGLVAVTAGPFFASRAEALVAAFLTVVAYAVIAKVIGLSRKSMNGPSHRRGDFAICAAIVTVSASIVGLTHYQFVSNSTQNVPGQDDWIAWVCLIGNATEAPLDSLASRNPSSDRYPLFFLGISWIVAALSLCVARLLLMSCVAAPANTERGQRWLKRSQWLDASIGGMLFLGAGWLAVAASWWIAIQLKIWEDRTSFAAFIGSASSAALFVWFRQQLSQIFRQEQTAGIKQTIKPYLPVILSYASVLLFFLASAILLMGNVANSPANGLIAIGVASATLVCALFLPPEKFGLHESYRGRIARAFLGASNRPTNEVIDTTEQLEDDTNCVELSAERPYHLICCAANDVAGDPLSNLNRGARSATISRNGVMIGRKCRSQEDLRYSSAITASAAAFNSQMGLASVKLGPAVAFLMCSLNARLGLWLRHPEAKSDVDGLFPGWPRFLEMFNQTRAYCSPDNWFDLVHLSDGAHFENLGLYELIRRRCRFIIVSDAGEDQNVKFEDFGNAVRRIREDFNADIDIDLGPLQPDERGLSKQHVAVGTIRYDVRGTDFDIGVLVYFKPALTGDEPVDVSNYKALNPAFPHEPTADQFYDEAQWEAYRALGYHAAFQAFHFLDGQTSGQMKNQSVAKIFSDARNAWYPSPPDFEEKMVRLNERFLTLERRLATEAPSSFVREIYPELAMVEPQPAERAEGTGGEKRCVHLITEMIQLIEDVWLIAEFEKYYNHPFMVGWINAFNRWSRSKQFRRWWPLLSPLYSSGMRRFAEARFQVPCPPSSSASSLAGFQLRFSELAALELPGELRGPCGTRNLLTDETRFFLEFSLAESGKTEEWVTVGSFIVRCSQSKNGGKKTCELCWKDDDFYVRPGMWHSGFGTAFIEKIILDKKIGKITDIGMLTVEVTGIGEDGVLRSVGSRRERNDLFMFYSSLGFALAPQSSNGTTVVLKRTL